MAKMLEHQTNNKRKAMKRSARSAAKRVSIPAPRRVRATITPEQYPTMTASGRAFLARVEANPTIHVVMRDLADK